MEGREWNARAERRGRGRCRDIPQAEGCPSSSSIARSCVIVVRGGNDDGGWEEGVVGRGIELARHGVTFPTVVCLSANCRVPT